MERRTAALRLVLCAGGAAAGLVAAHAAAYVLALPSAVHRHEVLGATGHDYLSVALVAAAAVALVAGAGSFAVGYASRAPELPRPSLLVAATRWAGIQSLAFVALEVGERALSGASLATLSPELLVIGVLVQVVLGLAVQTALAVVERAGAWASRRRTTTRAPRTGGGITPSRIAEAADLLATGIRGPPGMLAR